MKKLKERQTMRRPSSQRKLADILTAAEEEFLTNGFSAATIEAIAARAQVSKVTIYNHFGDKTNLFEALLNSMIGDIKQNFDLSKLEQNSLREILLNAARDMMTFLTNEKMVRFERILAAEVNRDPDIGVLYLDVGPKAMQQNLSQLLDEAINRGEIVSDDVMASAEMLAGLVMGRLDMLLRYGSKLDLTEVFIEHRVERAVDAWLKIHAV